MSKSVRLAIVVVLSAAAVIIFARLGFWQVARHSERQQSVREYSQRLNKSPVPLRELNAADTSLHLTPVTVQGIYDFSNEMLLTGRTRRGAPGVHIVTPLIVSGSDSIVMVNRGWVYSPDGATIEIAKWRAGLGASDSVSSRSQLIDLTGLAMSYPDSSARVRVQGTLQSSGTKYFSYDQVVKQPGSSVAPVYPYYVQLLPADTLVRAGVPVPLPPPSLSAGPHASYALQWFAFAAIAVVGCVVLLMKETRSNIQ